ncbi:hypothetical protein FB45DRAFT_1039664 [Roridomyces roridus]|uniref:Lysophospholipase n=1 Tax=Roridomyces roridus TaxID=1738132 RepID=A0AAD7FA73_9AGAR|nr:hypothetical protein FB45DRAFT_1039664 [Roridomyces roridus]
MRLETPSSFWLRWALSTQQSDLTISSAEAQYTAERRLKVLPSTCKIYLNNMKHAVEDILQSKECLPNVGISVSDGGYRAALFGAGVLNALDAGTVSSVEKGTGARPLQTAIHLAGISGGKWFVSSLTQAIFWAMVVQGTMRDGLRTSMPIPPSKASLQELAVKLEHFPVSVGDVVSGGSHLRLARAALPILVADLESKHISGTVFPGPFALAPLNSPLLEFNIFEMSCFDPAHTHMKHLGTTNNSVCVTDLDEAMVLSGA